ncbi:hypothetical protein CDCA_CDCA15G3955 [Cyanidium caldarium]|uniref:RRM Nup35-type domain-containing protein n=1 Tax=Cyanidium caldarium TaxID=2771 RepID=A0AAV9J0T3_CYACA|nr:hypothetical protein CDCA_CDCA15G3955 [Cyanidium caldarium]
MESSDSFYQGTPAEAKRVMFETLATPSPTGAAATPFPSETRWQSSAGRTPGVHLRSGDGGSGGERPPPHSGSAYRNWGGYGRFARHATPSAAVVSGGRALSAARQAVPPNESWLDADVSREVRLSDAGGTMGGAGARGLFTPAASRSPPDYDAVPSDWEAALACWVTVFGFAPGQQAMVLREMRALGHVQRYVARKGNWMHVQYATALQAQTARSRVARFLNANTLFGVVPCTEPEVVREEQVGMPSPLPGELSTASIRSGAEAWTTMTPAPAVDHNRSLRWDERTPVDAVGAKRSPLPATVMKQPPPPPRRGLIARAADFMWGW